jgi:hypothetical protein
VTTVKKLEALGVDLFSGLERELIRERVIAGMMAKGRSWADRESIRSTLRTERD